MRISIVGMLVGILLVSGSLAGAQSGIVRGSDGASGTVTEAGTGLRIYSDSHGNAGTIQELNGGMQPYQFSSPDGRVPSGAILNLGPAVGSGPSTAPQHSTPPYSLHSKPYGPLVTPSLPDAPTAPTGSVGVFGGGGRGR